MSISTEIAPLPTRPRRMTAARTDWAVAAVIVLVLLASGMLGVAMAGLWAVALLVARLVWLGPLAMVLRRRSREAVKRVRRRGISPRARALRVATMSALLVLLLAGISLGATLTGRSDSSLSIRVVEWARDNGARSLVSSVEGFYYTLTAPAKGGPTLEHLPSAGVRGGAGHAAFGPRDITPPIRPRLPGEGVWRPTQARYSRASAPILVTTLRPDPSYPRVVAGVAWINPHRASVALYPGLKEPGGGSGAAEVPSSARPRLLATFNSGFKHADSHGGFYAAERLFQPLMHGQGTIVGRSDGSVDVQAWTGGSRPGPGITFARQNLPLIVSGGRLNPALDDSSRWGVTLGNSVLVWRSGVGVDRNGNLIYAAANYQSAKGLARLLIRAGAVRAIQLDINSYWVSFNTFRHHGGAGAQKLLAGSTRSATRYLTPDDRDFFAVYAR